MVESPARHTSHTLHGMKQTHPAYWGAGLAGTFIGALLAVIGMIDPAGVGSLAGGYGLMMIGSAVFLLAGLKLRERLIDRAESIRVRRAAMARLTAIPAPMGARAPLRSGS